MSDTAPLATRAPRASSMRRDLLSAYVATGAKVGSWALVSAVVYRHLGAGEFAILALVRGTIGLLNYISLGLAPALIHNAARADAGEAVEESRSSEPPPNPLAGSRPIRSLPPEYRGREKDQQLSYHTSGSGETFPLPTLYASALLIAALALLVGCVATVQYGVMFRHLYKLPLTVRDLAGVVILMGFGTLLRLIGDAPGAVLQVRGLLAMDNLFVALGDLLWAVLATVSALAQRELVPVAAWYAASGLIPLVARLVVAHRETGVIVPDAARVSAAAIRLLLGYGSMVVLAQLADYLYAPTDYILIDHLLTPLDIAHYAPALQIDAALLLLVAGVSSVLLPRAAVAHAQGDRAVVMRYYIRGTLASLVVLTVMSAAVWALAPWVFQVWLGDSMPETRKILPLLLICTTLGGSSGIGRSVLLAVGRVWPFTVSVLIAGVVNVVCSYVFVTRFHWGLAGIVMGTVVAVVGRCVVWMPWYVWKALSEGGGIGAVEDIPRDTGL